MTQNNQQNTEVEDNTAVKEALQCEIGIKLQQAREAKNFSPDYIIKELKFSKTFLEALESGEWHKMPGEVYALGFLKQYASLLDLDISQEVERIKNKNFELTTPLTYPDAAISPNRKWTALAVIVFIVLIVAVNFSGSDEKPSIQISDNEQIIEQTQTETDNNTLDLESAVTDDGYTQNLQPYENIQASAPPEIIELTKRTYSFYAATNDVWLQVYEVLSNEESKLLREVLLKKGQSFSIIDTPAKLMLTAGNARSLEILEGNKVLFAAGSLGEEGKVLKRFPINP